MDANFTDVELRIVALPLAVQLVNTEVQRTLQRCNTVAITEITKELVDILRYGSIQTKDTVTLDAEPVEVKKEPKKASKKGLKYA